MVIHHSHKRRNILQTFLLLCGMLVLLVSVGLSLFGSDSIILILIIASILTLLTPKASAWLTLRLYQARLIDPASAPELYYIIQTLSQQAGITTPLVFHIPSSENNAFAMREGTQPLIAVTDGLFRQLNQHELAAVLAHEIAHIKHDDLGIMMLADLLSRLTFALANAGWLMLIIFLPLYLLSQTPLPWFGIILLLLAAPTLSSLLQLALSRTREFDADLYAVQLTGDATALSSALTKIEYSNKPWWLSLIRPQRDSSPSLLRTHPATAERIRRLRELDLQHKTLFHTPSYNHITIKQHDIIHSQPSRRGLGVWF